MVVTYPIVRGRTSGKMCCRLDYAETRRNIKQEETDKGRSSSSTGNNYFLVCPAKKRTGDISVRGPAAVVPILLGARARGRVDM